MASFPGLRAESCESSLEQYLSLAIFAQVTNRDIMMVKMKSMMAMGFVFTSLLSMFNSIFEGKVVAKLPFVPISLVQGLSHRNLMGEDLTDCSFIFLYILCTMSIRQNIQKALGFAPSRAASKQSNPFGPDPNKYKF